MHKKLESELMSIAHSILQMKNRDDIIALHKKAQELHEKLAVLLFIDDYLKTTPNATETREELLVKIEKIEEKKSIKIIEKETPYFMEKSIEIESKKEEIAFEITSEEKVIVEESKKILTLEEELRDTVSVDITADLFQKEVKKSDAKTSLNDTLMQKNIQIGLNDRIAFVKHLFKYSQEDFNRVLSQLNTFKTEKEAKIFIANMVKPDYDWAGKEEYEERLIALVERKFL